MDFGGGRAVTCGGCLWCVGYCGLMGCRTRERQRVMAAGFCGVFCSSGKKQQ